MLIFIVLFLSIGLALPARADVAIGPTSLLLNGIALTVPLLLIVVLIETLILWKFWGQRSAYSLRQVGLQVLGINVITTLIGLLFIFLEDNDLFQSFLTSHLLVPFSIYFALTWIVEALLLKQYYAPDFGLTSATPFKASLAINLPTYLLLLGLVLIGPGQQSEYRVIETKIGMHTLETMAETYAVEWGGIYPKHLQALEHDAKRKDLAYWKEILDYTGNSALIGDSEPVRPGAIQYLAVSDLKTGQVTGYLIYGYDKDAQPIKKNANEVHILSNAF